MLFFSVHVGILLIVDGEACYILLCIPGWRVTVSSLKGFFSVLVFSKFCCPTSVSGTIKYCLSVLS